MTPKRVITVVGKRGRGKTSLVKALIKQIRPSKVFVLDYLWEYSDLKKENKAFVFPYDFEEKTVYDFCSFAWLHAVLNRRNLVVFDEVDAYGKKDKFISFLYNCGRHKNLNFIATAAGFYDLPVIVRKTTERYSIFQVTDERDLNFLKTYFDETLIEKIMNFETFEYINLDFS